MNSNFQENFILNQQTIITISGNLGSGKSTVGERIAKRLSLRVFGTGDLMREVAQRYNMTINEFNEYVNEHPEIDEIIDEEILTLAQTEKNLLLVSRLAWFFIPDSFKVYLYVKEDEGARRIFKDTKRNSEKYKNYHETLQATYTRFENSRLRFIRTYGVDITEKKHYDLYLDTTAMSVQEVENVIIDAYHHYLENKRKGKGYDKTICSYQNKN